jgi:hypothetical protein
LFGFPADLGFAKNRNWIIDFGRIRHWDTKNDADTIRDRSISFVNNGRVGISGFDRSQGRTDVLGRGVKWPKKTVPVSFSKLPAISFNASVRLAAAKTCNWAPKLCAIGKRRSARRSLFTADCHQRMVRAQARASLSPRGGLPVS